MREVFRKNSRPSPPHRILARNNYELRKRCDLRKRCVSDSEALAGTPASERASLSITNWSEGT